MATIRRGPLAGWASFTINGEVWNVVGDLEYRPSGMTNETLKGQSAVEGFGQMPVEGEISATIRDRDDRRIGDLQGASGFTIIAELANGKVVTGTDMWQVSGLSDAVFSRLPASVVRQARDYVVRFEEEARERLSEQIEGWGDDLPAERTLAFRPPIPGGSQSWGSMSLRSPTVGQMRPAKALLKKPSLEALFRSDELLITAVSGWPKVAVLRLPISRYVEAAGYLNAFFPDGR